MSPRKIPTQMDTTTTVFFFIRDASLKEVRLPTFCGVGLGEKNGMYVYKPTITRTKTSFFRSRLVSLTLVFFLLRLNVTRKG